MLLGSVVALDCQGPQAEGHAATFTSLFLSQGVGCDQRVLVIGVDGCGTLSVPGFVASLPYNLTTAPEVDAASHAPSTTQSVAPDALAGGGGTGSELRIAWQYGKYLSSSGVGKGSALTAHSLTSSSTSNTTSSVIQARGASVSSSAAPSSQFCHKFDLARVLPSPVLAAAPLAVFQPDITAIETSAASYYASALRAVKEELQCAAGKNVAVVSQFAHPTSTFACVRSGISCECLS